MTLSVYLRTAQYKFPFIIIIIFKTGQPVEMDVWQPVNRYQSRHCSGQKLTQTLHVDNPLNLSQNCIPSQFLIHVRKFSSHSKHWILYAYLLHYFNLFSHTQFKLVSVWERIQHLFIVEAANLDGGTPNQSLAIAPIQGGPERMQRLWSLISRTSSIKQFFFFFFLLGRKLIFQQNDTMTINFG